MALDLQIDEGLTPDIDVDGLQQTLHHVQQVIDDPRLSNVVCLRICDVHESRQLNEAYRGKDAPTNVLSFPAEFELQALAQDEVPLGDLAVCWPVVLEEAHAQGKTPDAHFTHLVVHGLLHLLGLDHIEDKEAREMESIEVNILERLGISNPYELCH